MQCVVGKATSDRKHDSIFYGYCYYTNVFSQNQWHICKYCIRRTVYFLLPATFIQHTFLSGEYFAKCAQSCV